MKPRPLALLPLLLVGVGLFGCHSRSQEPPWDVGDIVGQPIDVVKQKLGPPQSEAAPPANLAPAIPSPTAQSTWKSDDTTLSATWKTGNKRVTSWEIKREEANAVSDENKAMLLKPGRLQESDPRYSVDWVEATDRPLFYVGARIVPAPKTHAVVLRVTGASALLEVTYQITGSQPQGETSMTIAPWFIQANVADDAQMLLKARVLKSELGGSADVKVEILSDGKVVASDASTGRTVQCQFEL